MVKKLLLAALIWILPMIGYAHPNDLIKTTTIYYNIYFLNNGKFQFPPEDRIILIDSRALNAKVSVIYLTVEENDEKKMIGLQRIGEKIK